MVRNLAEPGFADEFDQYQSVRTLTNCLTVIRCSNEVGQADLAGRMGCSQSKVSKMESSVDADLNYGDIINYVLALKQSVHIVFSPKRRKGSDPIRFHIEAIKHELDRLVKISDDDKPIGDSVETFAIDTARNVVGMMEAIIDKLPHRSQPDSSVTVEAEGDRGQRMVLDNPKRYRKRNPTGDPVPSA